MIRFNKIFGIGITKTGTTSLTSALNHLGIRATHWPRTIDKFHTHQALTDTTVACRFKELDLIFPGSLYIYTVREKSSWIESAGAHFRSTNIKINEFMTQEANIRIYGKIIPSPEDLSLAYDRHEEAVLKYFKSRRESLLIMNITEGESWEKLCPFLGTPIPTISFPRLHARKRPRKVEHLG